MNAQAHCEPRDRVPIATDLVDVVDPLAHDRPSDERFTATRRALCRVATVAAEAGARFQREGGGMDPMGWMLAPRTMFGGVAPLDACLERGPFLRGVLVHGLALDLDIGAEEIDDLLGDDVGAELGGEPDDRPDGPTGAETGPCGPALRLFTATFAHRDGSGIVHGFHASLARDASEVRGRLLRRFGSAAADAAVRAGFDPGEPMAEALVSPAVADTLMLVFDEPGSPLAAGLDLNVEQRFAA